MVNSQEVVGGGHLLADGGPPDARIVPDGLRASRRAWLTLAGLLYFFSVRVEGGSSPQPSLLAKVLSDFQLSLTIEPQFLPVSAVDQLALCPQGYTLSGAPASSRNQAQSRSVSTFWALWRGASFAIICLAATWSSHSTFTRFYRLNVAAGPSFAEQVLGVARTQSQSPTSPRLKGQEERLHLLHVRCQLVHLGGQPVPRLLSWGGTFSGSSAVPELSATGQMLGEPR
ncbi:unnamed protein product [Gadus morhua 'NCC']